MKKAFHHFLNHSRRGNIIIAALIIISLIGFTLETEYPASPVLLTLNYLIAALFAIEYGIRIWTAPLLYPDVVHPRVKYVTSFAGVIDMLACLPGLLFPSIGDLIVIRTLRILRLIQLMKIKAVTNGLKRVGHALYETRMEMAFSIGVSLGLIFLGAVLMYVVEGTHNPDSFGSVPRALWWSMATLTTVGYGDAVPITGIGKVTASFIALVGIVAVALPAGILASAFSTHENRAITDEESGHE